MGTIYVPARCTAVACTFARGYAAVDGNSKAQRFLATRVMLTLNGLLQIAQAQGDQNATAALKVLQTE